MEIDFIRCLIWVIINNYFQKGGCHYYKKLLKKNSHFYFTDNVADSNLLLKETNPKIVELIINSLKNQNSVGLIVYTLVGLNISLFIKSCKSFLAEHFFHIIINVIF